MIGPGKSRHCQTWLENLFTWNENLQWKQNWTAKSTNLKENARKVKSVFDIIAELRWPEGPPSGAPYSYRKEKETHELIFSWLSWLAVSLVGAYARRRRRRRRRSRATWWPYILQMIGWQRHATLVYRVLLWYWTSMLWSIDTCQNKVSADQYHATISRAQV